MHQELAWAVAVIVAGGVAAQWAAAWLRLPSVLVLLPLGVLAGPVTGVVVPQELFGDALFPLVAIAVGLILFEGGLGLRLSNARVAGRPVLGLVTIGVAITWVAGGVSAVVLFGFSRPVGFLLGAILVVSGPTVVLPLLQSVRLRDPVAPILRWECIAIDPIGALLAVAVFEAILDTETGFNPLTTLAASTLVGVAAGVAAGFALAGVLRLHLVPDRLHNPLTLAIVVGCFVAANSLSVEAGLFATTTMGVVLANQRLAAVKHIEAFGEDLGVLVLGGLFIVLGATIDFAAMRSVLVPSVLLLVVLLAVRPIAVWASTLGAKVSNRERAYLSLIAPRGVVAASVAALFSVSLEAEGVAGASELAPAAFCVIIGSVGFSSLVARRAAARLRVAAAEHRGILLAGSDGWLLETAVALGNHGVSVLLVTMGGDARAAAQRGVLCYDGLLESEDFHDAIASVGIGVALVAVESETDRAFLVERLSDRLGRENVYAIAHDDRRRSAFARAWGRQAFDGRLDGLTWDNGANPSIEVIAADQVGADTNVVPLFYLAEDRAPVIGSSRPDPGADSVLVLTLD